MNRHGYSSAAPYTDQWAWGPQEGSLHIFECIGCWITNMSSNCFVCDSVLFTVQFLLTMFLNEQQLLLFLLFIQVPSAHRWCQRVSLFIWHTVHWFSQTQFPLSSFNKPDAWLARHGWLLAPSASTHSIDIQPLDLMCITLVHIYSISLMADGLGSMSISFYAVFPLRLDHGSRHMPTQHMHLLHISSSSLMADMLTDVAWCPSPFTVVHWRCWDLWGKIPSKYAHIHPSSVVLAD